MSQVKDILKVFETQMEVFLGYMEDHRKLFEKETGKIEGCMCKLCCKARNLGFRV